MKKKNIKSVAHALILILIFCMAIFAFAACGNNTDVNNDDDENENNGSPEVSEQTVIENTVRDFFTALQNTDYDTAVSYCTEDFKTYINGIVDDTGIVTDSFSEAVANGVPLQLVELKSYYDEEDGMNFEITEDKLAVNFVVKYDVVQPGAAKNTVENYLKVTQGTDGKYLIEGISSGR